MALDNPDVRGLLEQPNYAVVSTLNADGSKAGRMPATMSLAETVVPHGEMAGLKDIVDQRQDLGALISRSPYLTIGTPDFFLERVHRFAELGYDEFILRIDGMTHADHIEAIRLIGEHVIPETADLAASPVQVSRAAS